MTATLLLLILYMLLPNDIAFALVYVGAAVLAVYAVSGLLSLVVA